MKKKLFLLIIAVFGMVSGMAQPVKEKDLTDEQKAYVKQFRSSLRASSQLPSIWLVSNNSREEVNLPNGLETETGPNNPDAYVSVLGIIGVAAPVNLKISLYVPKLVHNDIVAGADNFQGLSECLVAVAAGGDLSKFTKVHEFPVINKYTKINDYYESDFLSYRWNAMTDPQFTKEESRPVHDCITMVVENADTGERIIDPTRGERLGGTGVSRYKTHIREGVALDNSKPGPVKADIYFGTKLPVKNVTAFLVDDYCTIPNLEWVKFRQGGEQVIANIISVGGDYLKAYKAFPAPVAEDAQNGIYHLTWDVIGKDGKAYDPGKNAGTHYIGLVIEGYDDAVYMTGREGYITDRLTAWEGPFLQPALGTAIDNPKQDDIKISGFPGGLLILANEPASGICKVYTIDGKEVLQQSLSKPATTIPLRPGIYVVEVQAGGETKTQKVYVSCNC
jgi:hypothetical protein